MKDEITNRDNALFEAGIKLGAVYHQFIGMPIRVEFIEEAEKIIAKSIASQPYVIDVNVDIDPEKVKKNYSDFGYAELKGEYLSVTVVVEYGGVRVTAGMDYDEEKEYPLMRIEKIESQE
jgi:hypothetical protein